MDRISSWMLWIDKMRLWDVDHQGHWPTLAPRRWSALTDKAAQLLY